MMRLIQNAMSLLLVAGVASTALSADVYWDLNGSAPGVGDIGGGFNDGTWDAVNTYWNPLADGTGTTQAWVDGDVAHFSAGTDANDGIATISGGPKTLGGLVVEEGIIEFVGPNGSVVLGTNPTRINQGATLRMPTTGFSVVSIAAGHVLTMDGGALQSQIAGFGSGVWSGLGTIELTSNGGTVITNKGPSDAYSIMSYTGTINLAAGATTATFTKKGLSELRIRNSNQFTTLDIQEGLLRLDSTGGTEASLGNANGLVKIAGGAVGNNFQGAALGTSATIVSPASRSFELTGVGSTPDSMFVLNSGITIDGPVSGAGGLMVNGLVRQDTFAVIGSQGQVLALNGTNTYQGNTTINFGTIDANNGSAIPDTSRVQFSDAATFGTAAGTGTLTVTTARFRIFGSETIGSLAGTRTVDAVTISGPTVSLTTGADNTSTSYAGTIVGTGNLVKTGDGTFTMTGTNTYSGNTTVLDGTLSTATASLADLADVFLTTGATFNLNFAGTDTIDSLFIDGVGQAIGTWGGVGSGAANISPLLSGTGLLQVTTLPSAGFNGDFDNDGKVDAEDYTVWRDNFGSTTALPNDNALGTPIGNAHYDLWKANFGMGAGSGSLAAAGVPEPSSMVLLLAAIVGVAAASRRK